MTVSNDLSDVSSDVCKVVRKRQVYASIVASIALLAKIDDGSGDRSIDHCG
jgi:hypothetical protein